VNRAGLHPVRLAGVADAPRIGQLLHDFQIEFGDETPGPEGVAARVVELLRTGETSVLLGGDPPRGVAVLRFRPAIFTPALDCYLAELYVEPPARGRGLGRALMEAAIEHARERGADRMDLGTSEQDAAARGLYESLGFSNREGGPDGPIQYCYERPL
jgi:ribosomal protein S18 acetylase RimI-like enzyme